MKPAPFTYHAPSTLGEAASILAEHAQDGARVLAGGQSLVPAMALRLARPEHLVDINRVAGLDRVCSTDGSIEIGATVRHARFHSPGDLGALGPLLASVVRHIAHYPIRQRGTFCGSLAHADPASEWCLIAAALGGEITATSKSGVRTIAATDFFQGIMTTDLRPDEILTCIRLEQISKSTCWAFEEFAMRAGDFAVAMTLVTFDIVAGQINSPRIALGGIEPTPRRIWEAEALLQGAAPTRAVFIAAADALARAVDPIGDWQASPADRRQLAAALVRRNLEKAAGGNLA